eukprot:Skav223863  [mRNA]  locus=scaffold1226:93507:94314:- [translate_table: standard]
MAAPYMAPVLQLQPPTRKPAWTELRFASCSPAAEKPAVRSSVKLKPELLPGEMRRLAAWKHRDMAQLAGAALEIREPTSNLSNSDIPDVEDRIWEHVKKSIPKTVTSRSSDGHVDTENIMCYVYARLWRRKCKKALWHALGELCSQKL